MGRRYRGLRSRWKLIAVWVFLGLLVIAGKFSSYCSSSPTGSCEALGEELLLYAKILFIVIALGMVVGMLATRLIRLSRPLKDCFRDKPWDFDGKPVQLTGRVEKVLENSLSGDMRRKVTDVVRTVTASNDHTNRHIQQRFLLSSPQLRKGERLMVIHNAAFGKLKLSAGKWITLKGIYLHKRSKKRSAFGKKLTYYGRIHYTHEPKGFVKMLPRRPDWLEYKQVMAGDELKNEQARRCVNT